MKYDPCVLKPLMFIPPSHLSCRLSSKFTQSLSSSIQNYSWSDRMAVLQKEEATNPKCSLLCLYWFQYSHFLLYSLFVVARSFRTSLCLSHQIKNVLFGEMRYTLALERTTKCKLLKAELVDCWQWYQETSMFTYIRV